MAALYVHTLFLSRQQRYQLYSIRRRASPQEGVALLLGTYQRDRSSAIVSQVIEMENIDHSYSTFAIDPEEQYRILIAATKDQLDQVGVFHSHPAPPYPSQRDLQFMEHNPCVWIIDGIQGKRRKLKAYQVIEGNLHSVRLQSPD